MKAGLRRRLRIYLLVALLARLSDEGMGLAVMLLALDRTGSAAEGAFVLTAWMAPHVIAAPVAGTLIARTRRPGRCYALTLGGLAVAVSLLAAGLGHLPLGLTLTLAVAGGACGPVVSGGLSSLVAELVPPEGRGRAYGLDAAVYNAASVAGPALVSVLAVAHTPTAAAIALACGTGVAALLATGLTGGEQPSPTRPKQQRLALGWELTTGLRTLVRVPELRAITASTTLAFVGLGGLGATAVMLADAEGSPVFGGLLMTSFTLGALLGSLMAARWEHLPPPRFASYCLFVLGLALTIAALTASWQLRVAMFAVAGLAEGPLLSATLRIRADHSPPALRAQVFTTGAGLKIFAAACGTALIGAAADTFKPSVVLLCLAGTQLTAAPLQFLLNRTPARASSRS